MRASCCIVGNFALAIGAFAGLRFGSGRRGELVDLLHHDEDNKGQNQKVHNGVNKAAIGEHGSACFFSGLKSGVFLAV